MPPDCQNSTLINQANATQPENRCFCSTEGKINTPWASPLAYARLSRSSKAGYCPVNFIYTPQGTGNKTPRDLKRKSLTTCTAGGLRKDPKRGYWLVEVKLILTFIMLMLIFHILSNRFLIETYRTDTVSPRPKTFAGKSLFYSQHLSVNLYS